MTQPKQTKRRFSSKFKPETIEQVVKYPQSVTEVARTLTLDTSQLGKWIRQYKSEVNNVTPENPAQHRIQSLRARIKRQEREKEILKQAAMLMGEIPTASYLTDSSHFILFSEMNVTDTF